MTEPSAPRPAPGPGRPVPGPAVLPADRGDDATDQDRFADLDRRTVAEHVEVFETEHDRLQSELGTIDRV